MRTDRPGRRDARAARGVAPDRGTRPGRGGRRRRRTPSSAIGGRDYRVRTQPRTGEPGTRSRSSWTRHPPRRNASRCSECSRRPDSSASCSPRCSASGWASAPSGRSQAALALQRRFVTDASHELRTPLTLLSTRAQMLRRKLVQPAVDEAAVTREVDSVVADARHLAEILDDLLLVADLRAPIDADVDMVELVAAVLDAARPGAAELGVTVAARRARARDRPRHGGRAPPGRHRRRRQRGPPRRAPGRVPRSPRTPTLVAVEIADDGPGIDAAVLPRVFQRFATSGTRRQDRTRRYGIGLALVSEVITRHSGTVTAVNPPDGGAAFRIILPSAPTTGARR